ncbi:hypothetical protein RRG08_041714 [Elysia crispata]|uniref:Uncharacterized protein n=1 Tax=Elysia crispata TaxID=231223 RepID=A0AAE0YZ49_9GAST|nr:hypothetical protein RRG08_041714 [Elysia crispata]
MAGGIGASDQGQEDLEGAIMSAALIEAVKIGGIFQAKEGKAWGDVQRETSRRHSEEKEKARCGYHTMIKEAWGRSRTKK